MLFREDALDRIRSGRVSVVFRRWRQGRVLAGTRLRTAIGLVEVRPVAQVDDVAAADAGPAGYDSVEALRADVPGDPGRPLFRIEVALAGADPRVSLRETVDGVGRLDRLDSGSGRGPWTRTILGLIDARPAIRAGDLFAAAGHADLAASS